MRVPGFMRSTRPSVAYFSSVNGLFTFADGKNTWDIHYLIPVIGLSLKKDTTRLLFTPVLRFHQGLRAPDVAGQGHGLSGE